MNILQTFKQLFNYYLQTSFELLKHLLTNVIINITATCYEHLTNFLQISYELITNFLWICNTILLSFLK
jgi:hypothetical protein